MITTTDLDRLHTATVRSTDGHPVGRVCSVYTDDEGRPLLLGLRRGVFEVAERMVPVAGAVLTGTDLLVLASRSAIEQAPQLAGASDPTPEHLERIADYWDARSLFGFDGQEESSV